MHLEIKSGYMRVDNFDTMAQRLRSYDFDTIVATGVSGSMVAPVLSYMLEKNCLIVRKPDVYSHSHVPAEGKLGHRWIFVDDFVCTGKSLRRCKYVIGRISENLNFSLEYAGYYSYNEDMFYSPDRQDYKVKDYMKEDLDEAYKHLRFREGYGIEIKKTQSDFAKAEIKMPELTHMTVRDTVVW